MFKKLCVITNSLLITALLFLTQITLAHAHDGPHLVDVPAGGDSIFPWVMIFLTLIAVGVAALWMFRSGR